MERVKIMTNKGRVITLTVEAKTAIHYIGLDKYGDRFIIPISDIHRLMPLKERDSE